MPRPDVLTLYESGFVRHYDVRARVWENLVCREAMHSLGHRLRRLPDRPLRVLDLGCGNGRNLRRLADADIIIASYNGVDTTSRMIAAARQQYPYTTAAFTLRSAEEALRDDRTYDLIVATWLLSHHSDPATLIGDATARLSKTGRLVTLTITKSTRLRARLHGKRFERMLHSNPVDPGQLRHNALTFEHVSAGGLVTLSEYAPGKRPSQQAAAILADPNH